MKFLRRSKGIAVVHDPPNFEERILIFSTFPEIIHTIILHWNKDGSLTRETLQVNVLTTSSSLVPFKNDSHTKPDGLQLLTTVQDGFQCLRFTVSNRVDNDFRLGQRLTMARFNESSPPQGRRISSKSLPFFSRNLVT